MIANAQTTARNLVLFVVQKTMTTVMRQV